MNNLKKAQPTLADVRSALNSNKSIPEPRRRRIDNALNSVWRWTGMTLAEIPATMPALSKVMTSIEPGAHGVKRPTINNARNLVMHAMKDSGLAPALKSYRSRRKPLTPAWATVSARIDAMHESTILWALIHYCNDQGYNPSAVGDEQFGKFVAHTSETSFRANQHTANRSAALYWNKLRARCPDLQLQEISPPASKLRRLPYALADFPLSLQKDIAAWQSWLLVEDVFADNARARAVSKNTAGGYWRKLHRALNVLVDALGSVDEITDLRTVVMPTNFKRCLAGLLAVDKSAQKGETFATSILLYQMAKDWLECGEDHLAELAKARKKLRRPQMAMTDKNKKLASQFDDPAVRRRLFEAPSMIWADMTRDRRSSHRFRLARAQAAIAIGILTYMPLRLNNLTNLAFGQNIILRRGGTSSLIIPAEATKAGRAIEFDIPASLASLIIEFYDEIALSALGKHPEWLFCRTDGEVKGFAQVRILIQGYFKQQVGFHMNPHAFRHLCAKLILDANPGAHTLVQELLGHKSVETSTAFYAGLNSRRAGRHHSELIQKDLASQAPVQPRRRRRLKES